MSNFISPRRPFCSSVSVTSATLLLVSLWLLPKTTTSVVATASASSLPSSRSILAKLRQASASSITTVNASPGGGFFRRDRNNRDLFPTQKARTLQSGGGDVCEPSDVFDDTDSLQQFSASFEPACTCVFDSPFDISTYFEDNPFPQNATLFQDWINDLNTYGSNLESDQQLGCVNKCSACASKESPCLLIEKQSRSVIRAGLNISLEEFIAFAELSDDEAAEFFLNQFVLFFQKITSTSCYMAAGSSNGNVCFTISTEFSSEEGITFIEAQGASTIGCAMSVDDVDCTSCDVDAAGECLIADCTNIGGNSVMINTCNKDRASYSGVFGPFYDLEIQPQDLTYTLGSCDGFSGSTLAAPSAPSGTTSVAGPVSTPVAGPPLPPVPVPANQAGTSSASTYYDGFRPVRGFFLSSLLAAVVIH
jgi:hypothetical protein